jgi:hypothetical protein
VEFLWLFAYNLQGPITIGAGIGLALCSVMFLQGLAANNRSPTRGGDPRVAWSVISGIILSIVWASISAIPSPTYDVKIVEKTVPIQVIKKVPVYIGGTKIVYKEPTWDARFKYCHDEVSNNMESCMEFANTAKSPKIVEKKVPIKVYSGIKVVEKPAVYPTEFRHCIENFSNVSMESCKEYATDSVNSRPRVVTKNIIRNVPVFRGEKIIVKKDTYFDLWKRCNEAFSLERAPPNQFGALRNERMKICKDVALAGSR